MVRVHSGLKYGAENATDNVKKINMDSMYLSKNRISLKAIIGINISDGHKIPAAFKGRYI